MDVVKKIEGFDTASKGMHRTCPWRRWSSSRGRRSRAEAASPGRNQRAAADEVAALLLLSFGRGRGSGRSLPWSRLRVPRRDEPVAREAR